MRYVDFSSVEPKHREIDGRLVNWSRWATVHARGFVQPMFKMYRPDNFDDDRGSYDFDRPAPIDSADALLIEKAVCKLPEGHKLATVWFYRVRVQPVRACKALGVSRGGLAQLIRDSRQMLVNRGA